MAYVNLCQDATGFVSGISDIAGSEFKLSKKNGSGVFVLVEDWTAGVAPTSTFNCVNIQNNAAISWARGYGLITAGDYRVENRLIQDDIYSVWETTVVQPPPTATTTQTTTVGVTTTENDNPGYAQFCVDANCFVSGYADMPGTGNIQFKLEKQINGNFQLQEDWTNGIDNNTTPNCVNLQFTANPLKVRQYGAIGNGVYRLQARRENNQSVVRENQITITNCAPGQTTTQPNGQPTPNTFVNLCIDANCFSVAYTNITGQVQFKLQKRNQFGQYDLYQDWTNGNQSNLSFTCANIQGQQSASNIYTYGNLPNGDYRIDVRRSDLTQQTFYEINVACNNNQQPTTTSPTNTTQPTGNPTGSSVNICVDANCFATGFTNIDEDVEFKLMRKDGSGNYQLFRDFEDGTIPFSTIISNCANLPGNQLANRIKSYGPLANGDYLIIVRKKANQSFVVQWGVNINCNSNQQTTQPGQITTVQPTTTQPSGGSQEASVNLCQDGNCFITGITNINEDVEFKLNKKDSNNVYQVYQNWTAGTVPFSNVISNCVNLLGNQVANRIKQYGAIGSGNYKVEVRRLSNPTTIVDWELTINCENAPQPTTTQNQTTQPGQTTQPQQTTTRPVSASNDTVSGGTVGVAQLVNIKINDSVCNIGTTTFVVESATGCIVNMINSNTGIATVTPSATIWSFNYSIHCNGIKSSNTATVAGIANGQSTTALPVTTTVGQTTTQPQQTFPGGGGQTTIFNGNQLTIIPVGNIAFSCTNNQMNASSAFRNNSNSPLMIGTTFNVLASGIPINNISCDAGVISNGKLILSRTVAPSGMFNIAISFPHVCNVPINNVSICVQL